MIGFEIKQLFFDREAVTSRVDPATRKVLSKFGAFVRRRAVGIIRPSSTISRPPAPAALRQPGMMATPGMTTRLSS